MKAFRVKYGQGWDADAQADGKTSEDGAVSKPEGQQSVASNSETDNLLDMIGDYGQEAEAKGQAAGVREEKQHVKDGKGGER